MPVRVLTNSELMAAEAAIQLAEDEATESPVLAGIAGYIRKRWDAAWTEKQTVRDRIFKAKRARRGEYDPEKLRAIRQTGGSEEYGRITSNKCRVAESWLRDVYLGQTERPWTLKATPNPELPPQTKAEIEAEIQKEIMEAVATLGKAPDQEMIMSRRNELADAKRMRLREDAALAVERMEQLIADQMLEAGWHDEWADFLNDFATYPAAHFKGPIIRRRTELKWVQVGGKWKAEPRQEFVPDFERVDPSRCYPAPRAVTPQDGYFIEHITLSHGELYDLIGLDGFSEQAIRTVLEEGRAGGLNNWLSLVDDEGEEDSLKINAPDNEFDVVEYHGPLLGQDLLDWGLSESEIDDPLKEYEACAWLIGRSVIKATLNDDPLGQRPYYKACWEEIPGEYWGQGLPDSLEDVQGVVNAAIRSLVNNMGMASGPQVVVNVDRLPPGEEIESLQPWKIWQVHDSQYGASGNALDFFQPSANASELIGVMDKFYNLADDWSLIPRYMQGSDNISGGVGRTASGLSMMFNAANKGLKGVVSNIDNKVLAPMLRALYALNMMYAEDETLKADAQVDARGAVSLMQLETLQLRRNEFLQATANPIDSQIVGPEGRAEILREVAKGLEMDVNRVVPRRGQVPPMLTDGQQGQQAPQIGGGQALMNGAAVTDNFSPPAVG